MPDNQFQFLTPEMAQQLANASFAPEEQERLKEQLAQARALRQHDNTQYMTPGAAALGGIGHLANVFQSIRDEGDAKTKQLSLTNAQKDAAAKYLQQAELQRQHEEQLMLQLAQARALRPGGQEWTGPQAAAPNAPSPQQALMYGPGTGQ